MLSDLEMWSALVGAVLPPLIAVVNSPRYPKWIRGVLSVLLALLAAAITCWLKGDLSTGAYAHSVLLVLTATLVTYHTFWKPSSIAPSIEVATSR